MRAFLLAMLMACACGSGESSTSPGGATGVAASAEAGKVREITGKVTALRGGQVRSLAVGNPIHTDDMIDTGTDGSVVIELVHNHALWSLESGIKARVDQSPAWTLAKQDAAKPIDHATSAAGRHADRQAADTQVTVVEKASTQADQEASSKNAVAIPEPPKPTVRDTRGAKDVAAPTTALPKSRKGGGPPSKPALELPAPSAGDVPDSPDRSSVATAVQVIRPRLTRCFDKVTGSGTIKITARVGPDGKVTVAQIVDTPDRAIDACVLAIVRTMTLPASRNGLSFSFPIVVRGPEE